jgi:hypothetical protein
VVIGPRQGRELSGRGWHARRYSAGRAGHRNRWQLASCSPQISQIPPGISCSKTTRHIPPTSGTECNESQKRPQRLIRLALNSLHAKKPHPELNAAICRALFRLTPHASRPTVLFVCSVLAHPIATSKNGNFASAFRGVTRLDITSPARTQPPPRADAKLRLRAGCHKLAPAASARPMVALADYAGHALTPCQNGHSRAKTATFHISDFTYEA